jgi:DNA-binding NarL/FixJ family response regulator
MVSIVRHAVVLLIAEDGDLELELATVLAEMGCLAHRVGPDSPLDGAHTYDAAIVVTHQNTSWSAAALGRLRSTEYACASLVILDVGGPEDVAESLRRGAADCLIRPVSEPELLESVSGVIASTRMWRARFSRARLFAVEGQLAASKSRPAMARVFEPAEQVVVTESVNVDARDNASIDATVDRVSDERGLTRRERQVLHWLVLGHRYVDIASVLGVAPRTAKFHAANLLEKLGLDSRYDLARLLAEEVERDRR